MFEWVNGSAYSTIVTLYPGNLTLNRAAASYFDDVKWVMLGIDKSKKQVAIKPVTKREIDLNLVDKTHLHRISIGKGYARISSKMIMQEISLMVGKAVDGEKVSAVYSQKDSMLILDMHHLMEEVIE